MSVDPPGVDLFPPEDPYEFPSDEGLSKLSRQEQIKALAEWFHWNYEDPVVETPRYGGEYFYVWGGPHDAFEELGWRFSGVVDDDIIEAAANGVQSDGTFDWAPSGRRIRAEYEDDQDRDNSDSESDPVERVRQSMRDLENALDALPANPGGIGHNRAPEPLDDAVPYKEEDLLAVRSVVLSVNEQTKVEGKPDLSVLTASAATLSEVGGKIGEWAAGKLNLAIDEAVKNFGAVVGSWLGRLVVAGLASPLLLRLWDALKNAYYDLQNWTEYLQLPF